jgi:chromosome segregation ATPase
MAELVGWLVPMLVLGGSVGLLYYSFSYNEPELKQLTYEKGQLTARVAALEAGVAERDRDLEKLREQLRENESTLRYTKGELEKSLKRSGNAQEAAKRMKEIQGLQMAESKRLLAMALNPSSTDEQRRAALQQLHDHLHHPPAHKGRIKRVKTKKGKNPWAREKAVA